jgi:hypothetical protein
MIGVCHAAGPFPILSTDALSVVVVLFFCSCHCPA